MDEAAKKILIVDDEKALAHALELKLGFLKYDVTVANDGNAALEILKSQKFDLILLDAVMPQKNGFEVLEELGKLKITTPVIMLSNLSQSEDIENFYFDSSIFSLMFKKRPRLLVVVVVFRP